MGKLLNPNTYTNSGTAEGQNPKTGVGLADLASNQVLISDLSGAKPPQTVTILDGVITPTGAFCKVGTEGESPADDLARINSTRTADDVIHEGMVLHLCALDDAQVVTVKHSADIILAGGEDVVLSTANYIVLQYIQGVWREIQVIMGADVKTAIAGVQDTFSTTAAVGKTPVAIADPETGEVGFDESWKMGNEVTQTINPDPTQASAEAVPSEQATSTALQSKVNTSDITNYVDYRVIYGTGQKAVYDPTNPNAIEDDALGANGVVSINSFYTLASPFGSHPCICTAEVFVEGGWMQVEDRPGFSQDKVSGSTGIKAYGTLGLGVTVSTGTGNIVSSFQIGSKAISTSILTSAPCRVHVWKIGG